MQEFSKEKDLYLRNKSLLDKSRKGSLDNRIADLVHLINSSDGFYTTSSCSGRILLIHKHPNQAKHEVVWCFVTHDLADCDTLVDEFRKAESEADSSSIISFKMEGAILHICAKDIDKANTLLEKSRKAGFRRAGIISAGKRIMIEIISTELIDAPVIIDGVAYASAEYIKKLAKEANRRLQNTWNKIRKLEKDLTQES